MQIIRSKEFTADRAWGSISVANMNGITTRVHWSVSMLRIPAAKRESLWWSARTVCESAANA